MPTSCLYVGPNMTKLRASTIIPLITGFSHFQPTELGHTNLPLNSPLAPPMNIIHELFFGYLHTINYSLLSIHK